MEIIVAMAVLTALAMAAGSMLISSMNGTSNDRQRVRGANVAAQEIELVRGQMQTNPSVIDLHLVKDQVTSGTKYHVVRSGAWQAADSFSALNLTVTVTWPNMRGVKPVVNSSVLTALGTAGDGSGGVVVSVSAAPTVAPDPLITVSPSCNLNTSAVTLSVNTQASVVGVPTLTALVAGTVVATPAAGNPCSILSLPVVAGVATGSLPYGSWNLSVTTSGGTASESVTINGTVTSPATLNILDTRSCANTGLVTLTVNAQNLLSLLTSLLSSGTVTATRAATATCAATTQTINILAGLGTANLSYGDWTFTSGTASATATISSPLTVAVNLTVDDTSCPAISGPVTLTANTKTTVLGITTTVPLASGTITATRTANGSCTAQTQAFTVTAGTATGTLPYGTWTFAVTSPSGGASYTGSWPTATVSSSAGTSATVSLLGSCSTTPTTVSVGVKQRILGLNLDMAAGTLRATMTANGACQPATSVTSLIVLGHTSISLLPGTWTFSVDGLSPYSSTPASAAVTVPGATTTANLVVQ
jgi:hypothetical protein